jgi:anti-sigma regulatory factor (Ser/Thr protein kinase)
VVSDEMFEMPDPMSSRGRGFFLMRELTDLVEVHSTPSGTTVMLVWDTAKQRTPNRSKEESV